MTAARPMRLTLQRATLDWEAAHLAVRAAVECARVLGQRVSASVLDPSGVELAFLRMPGASLHSIEVARDKAYTAASFGFPSRDWDELLATFSPAVRQGIILRPRLVVFGGGLPILAEGQLVAAIGVSGASEDQDEQCARAALAALGLD